MQRFFVLLAYAVISLLYLATPSHARVAEKPLEDKSSARRDESQTTVFNGQNVPPVVELSGKDYKDKISKGYWFVKGFSPYCGHCTSLAPKFQTIYEYYYTLQPPEAKNPQETFTSYYGLNFAELNCVAYGDACGEMDIQSYPQLIFFKDGVEIKKLSGDRDIEELGQFIEGILEYIKPGSRPKEGVEWPQVGAREFHSKNAKLSSSRPVNPDGVSFSFDYDSFQELQKNTLDVWFIKFFDPWCPHCIRMSSAWKQMALEMKGKLNVGEVDCSVQQKLCIKEVIRSYPNIKLLRGPAQVEYQGLRGVGDFLDYARRATEMESGIKRVTAKEFEDLEKVEEVIFIYFYNHATTSEDILALDRFPMLVMGKARIVKSDDPVLAKRFNVYTWPRLVVSRDGRPDVFDALAPQDIRNVTKVEDWMTSVWLPIVPEISTANVHQLMDNNLVVMAVLSRDREQQFAVAKREIKNAALEYMSHQEEESELKRKKLRDAKQLRIEQAQQRGDEQALKDAKQIRIDVDKFKKRQVVFTWVDGVFWERWIRTTFGISVHDDGERIIINDQLNRRYWDTTSAGNPIFPSKASILDTLSLVVKDPPGIPAKLRGWRIWEYAIRSQELAARHPWLTTWLCVGAVVSSIMISFRLARGHRRGFGPHASFRPDGKLGTGYRDFANGKFD